MRKMHVVWLAIGIASLAAFQNCSSSLPSMDDQNSSTAVTSNVPAPTLYVINSSFNPGAQQTVYALGGQLPLTYSVSGGGCTIDAATGLLTAGATVGATCNVVVTDARSRTDTKPVTIVAAAAQTPTVVADPVTVKATVFEYTGQTQQFVIPAYNNLKVEVWGGGGAGGVNVGFGAGAAGASGGSSAVTASGVNVSATGGGGGTGSTMSGNAISGGLSFNNGSGGWAGTGSSPGAAGTIYGGGNGGGPGGGAGAANTFGQGAPSVGPVVPGGGGGGYSGAAYSGGGGGGGYSVQTFAVSSGPAKNSTLSITVGAGGASAAGATISGAAGRVIITVN